MARKPGKKQKENPVGRIREGKRCKGNIREGKTRTVLEVTGEVTLVFFKLITKH